MVCKLQWVSYLLKDFQVSVHLPISLQCDKKATMCIVDNPIFHEQTKHLNIDCHVVRNQLAEGFIKLVHVSSQNHLADLFMKPLSAP